MPSERGQVVLRTWTLPSVLACVTLALLPIARAMSQSAPPAQLPEPSPAQAPTQPGSPPEVPAKGDQSVPADAAAPGEAPQAPDASKSNNSLDSMPIEDDVATFHLPAKPPRFPETGLSLAGVRLGWNNSIRAERHGPIWVKLDSGSESVQGTVTLEYTQDASQRARIVVPFSTTPNTGALVELVGCLPAHLTKFSLVISDGDARRTIEFTPIPAPDAIVMPTLALSSLTIMGMHEGSANSIVKRLASDLAGEQALSPNSQVSIESVFANASLISCDPAELAHTWMAYEGIDVLVAREEDLARAPERARDAIHEWVRWGGHLVLQTSAAAQTWRQVAPPGVPPEIAFDDRAESPISQALRNRIISAAGSTASRSEAAPTAMMRLARWDRGGPREGEWSAGWAPRLADAPRTDVRVEPRERESSPIASGPVGFGRVTLVGADPARLFPVLDSAHTAQAWSAILWDVIPEHTSAAASAGFNPYFEGRTSGATAYERGGIRGSLDAITIAAPVGPWFFLVTVAAVALLVLAVGPPGRFVLRRKGWLRSSWIVALALSGLACMVGLFAPMLVRSGQTLTSTLAVHDVLCDQRGEPALHVQTVLRSVFSGKPETIPFREDGGPVDAGRWWRGVSSAVLGEAGVPFGDPLTLILTQPAPGVARSSAALPVSLGQWTYRAFLEQRAPGTAADAPALRVSERVTDEGLSIRLRGLDSGKRVVALWVFTPEGSAAASTLPEPTDAGALEALMDSPALPASPLGDLGDRATAGNTSFVPPQGQEPLTWYASLLPGPSQRAAALHERIFSGGNQQFALVVGGLRDVRATAGAAARSGDGPRASFDFEVVRMLVPISDDALKAMRRLQGALAPPKRVPERTTSPKPEPPPAPQAPQGAPQ